ncbi:MAG TPA: hypothetical protein VEO95_08160 [Chthoniobacteraceae bacterium]|nr:hypothetical protein [Chthoniobacteraceae bacterium]
MSDELPMKTVGGNDPKAVWDQFDRLQRQARGGIPHPKGVFRFKTWEEFNDWKLKYSRQREPQHGKSS